MYGAPFDNAPAQSWAQPQAAASQLDGSGLEGDDSDSSHRPPNAFILYSNAMRSSVRQDNPGLSNTEVSRLLGKMWKEVPNETKQVYKQEASKLQEEFKHQHPNYTYRKARRKRALNELLTKNSQANPMMFPPGDPHMMAMYQAMQAGLYQHFPGQAQGIIPGMQQPLQPGIAQVPQLPFMTQNPKGK